MATQTPLGLFGVESLIDEEERAMRDTVRALLDARVRPHIGEWYESGFNGRFGTRDGGRVHYISDPQPCRGGGRESPLSLAAATLQTMTLLT